MRPDSLQSMLGQSDRALRGLASITAGEEMLRLLRTSILEGDSRILDCIPVYRRYKPGTNCLVSWELTVATASGERQHRITAKAYRPEDFQNARAKLEAKRSVDVDGLRSHAFLDDLDVVLFSYPNDLSLPALRELQEPKRVQRILQSTLTELDPNDWRISDSKLRVACLRYKPEKRALLRWSTRAKHKRSGARQPIDLFVRLYPDDGAGGIHSRMQTIREASRRCTQLRVPELLGLLSEHGAVLVRPLEGHPLPELPAPDELVRVGQALAELHHLDDKSLPARDTASLLREARDSVDLTVAVDPGLRPELDALWRSLESRAVESSSNAVGLVHGDFHSGQLLLGERVGMLDFDRSFRGDPIFDLGNFRAQWIYDRIKESAGADPELLAPLSDSYARTGVESFDADRLGFWTAYSLARLLATPFRELRPKWRHEVGLLLQAAERELS